MDEPFLSQARRHQKKSVWDQVTGLFPCFGGREAGQPAVELDASLLSAGDDELRSRLQQTQQDIQKAEQRASVAIVAREQSQKALDKEKRLRQQAEDALAVARRASSTPAPSPVPKRDPKDVQTISDLEKKLQRIERKLATAEKYKESLEEQLKQVPEPVKQFDLKEEMAKLEAQLKDAQFELEKAKAAEGAALDVMSQAKTDMEQLKKKNEELEAEMKFRDSLENKVDEQATASTVTAAPSRARGRGRRPALNIPAADRAEIKAEAEATAEADGSSTPPPVPMRTNVPRGRTGSIKARMQMFEG